jgi:serine/threonine-protein kinase
VSPILHLKPGTIFAGDFRIVSPLSSGGMGVVYVADQLSTGSQRALKIMLPELLNDQELRDRFLREARVCARIPSDHVVQVVAAGIDSGTPWLAMELLHGEDLAEYIERRGGVTPSGLIEIFRQLCHALGAAHSVGVVHRDLKPENIFLSVSKRAGAPFTVKVLDFGIAKMIADASAKMTALIGSPLWMAPEQMDPRMQISPATDVWPICLLAFWLLTGQHYWRSATIKPLSMHAIMREVLFEPLASASERAAELGVGSRIPFGFDQWFAHCITRDTSARIQNGAVALEELERCLGNGPRGTMPHPPSLAEIEAAQREHEQEQQAQAQAQHGIEPIDAVQEIIDAPLESDAFPPTLQSSFETTGPQEPQPPRAPAVSVSAPVSSAPPISTNSVASEDSVRRSSVTSVMPPIKSSAPLWMLAGGLVVLLVVVVVFVKQRADVQQTAPPKPATPATAATAAPTALPSPTVTAAPPPQTAAAGSSAAPVAPTAPAGTALAPAAPAAPATPAADSPSFPDAVDPGSSGTAGSSPGKSFDTAAATAALRSAAVAAKDCKRSYGPTGPGTVKVTFSPSGNVTSALLLAPQYAGTLVGTCVATKFLKLRVPAFDGTAITTNMPFEIPP